MRARLWCLALAILVFGGTGLVVAQSAMRWQTNLDAAKRLAAETNRLVLLHFWTESCGPCMRMEREVFSRPDVAAAVEANFVPVRVNVQHFPMTAREYGVNAWPTDLIITPQGGLIYRKTGGSDAAHYVALLNQVAAAVRNPGNQTYATANPGYPSAASAPMGQGGVTPSGVGPAQWPAYPPQANATGLPAGAAAAPPAYGPGPAGGQPPSGPGYYAGSPGAPQTQPAPQAQPAPQVEARPWQPEAAQWNGGAYPAAGGYGSAPEQVGAGPRAPAEQNQPAVSGAASGGYGRPAMEPNPQTPPGSPSQYGPARGLYRSVATPAVNPAPLGLDGYCPVSLGERERWVKGDPRYGVIHRERTYLFAGPEEANRFYADPDRYAPVMAGMDVVLAVEEHRQVPGRRDHGAWFERRVYLFASEATFRRFDQDPARFAAAAMQAATSMARRLPASPDPPAQSQTPPNLGYPPPARY